MRIFLLTYLLLVFTAAQAQEAKMILEQPRIKIGEQAILHFYFTYDNPKGDALVAWPYYEDHITDDIEIVDRTIDYEKLIDSTNGTYLREQKLVLTVFDSGEYSIPPQKFELNDSAFYTNPEFLKVETVHVDTTKGIYANKDNYTVPYPFSERAKDWFLKNWYWVAGVGLLALFFLIFRAVRKRKDGEEEVFVPVVPAHITALNALYTLKETEAWESQNKKKYYSELTDTVRLYLEQRFQIYAMEHTTREIINDLKGSDISIEDKQFLKEILTQADFVKFAKMKPEATAGRELLNGSIEFVERTKKIEEVESEEESTQSNKENSNGEDIGTGN